MVGFDFEVVSYDNAKFLTQNFDCTFLTIGSEKNGETGAGRSLDRAFSDEGHVAVDGDQKSIGPVAYQGVWQRRKKEEKKKEKENEEERRRIKRDQEEGKERKKLKRDVGPTGVFNHIWFIYVLCYSI